MVLAQIFFWLFSVVLLASAAMVVSSRNPVHSVLFLILAFFNAAGLLLLTGAEFLAMILVIVYVGAVAVLFLFVVMMLDVNFAELRSGFQRYAPVGAVVGALLFAELVFVTGGWSFTRDLNLSRLQATPPNVQNTVALGRLLYTHYILQFQLAGLVLLVAMIGAIVLTLRGRYMSRRQDINLQITRDVRETLEEIHVPLGAGVRDLGIRRPKVTEPPELTEEEPVGAHGHGHHAPEAR